MQLLHGSFSNIFFRMSYIHRAMVLETVAGVPGMVAGMCRHLRSLRRMQLNDDEDRWIVKLLAEAENERMHLMIWTQVARPFLLERMLVTAMQLFFLSFYAFLYVFFPHTAHRMVGGFSSSHSYTTFEQR